MHSLVISLSTWMCLLASLMVNNSIEAGFLGDAERAMGNLLGMNETEVPGTKDTTYNNKVGRHQVMTVLNASTTIKSVETKLNETLQSIHEFNAMKKYIYNVFAIIVIAVFVAGILLLGCWVTENAEKNFFEDWPPDRGQDPPYKFVRTNFMKIEFVDDPKSVTEDDSTEETVKASSQTKSITKNP